MNPSFELLLFVAVLAFYAYDALLLLYANEFLLIRSGGTWRFVYPAPEFQLARRTPYLNLVRPDIPVFRLCWTDRESYPIKSQKIELEAFVDELFPLKVQVIGLQLTMLIVLPLVLVAFGGGVPVLGVFATIYLQVALMLWVAVFKRKTLHLSGRKLFLLGLELILCPPLAINFVRRLTLDFDMEGDALPLAKYLLDAAAYERLLNQIRNRVEDQLKIIEPEAPRAQSLRMFLGRLGITG